VRAALLALLCAACGTESEGRPPVARITATPRAIPLNDDYTTDVVIDGLESADPIDDPEATMPLEFRWRILEDGGRFVGGDATSVQATIRLAGARPARLELTVTDADGDEGRDVMAMQLTVAAPPAPPW
jgi:hypothetical protein